MAGKSSFLIVFATMLMAGSLRAQSSPLPKFFIGATGGYSLIAYSTDLFSIPNTRQDFYVVCNGSGTGFSIGITSMIPIDTVMENFLVVQVTSDSKPGNFANISNHPSSIGYDTGYYLAASISYVLFNLGYRFNFWRGTAPNYLGFQVCASFGFLSQKKFDRTMDVYYSNSPSPISTTHDITSVPSAEAFRFAIRTEFTYDIPLFSNWLLTPSVGYDAPLTKVDPSLNWRASSLYFAMAVQLGL